MSVSATTPTDHAVGVHRAVSNTATRRDRALVPVLMFLGMVVAVVSSLGAPLIPSIAVDYQVSLGSAQWSLTIALLVGAVTAPVLGRLGDGPDRRRVMLGTLAAVLAGCVLAALPLGYGALLVGRGLQGIGLGLMPLAMTLARDHLPAARSASVVAILSITASAGVGLGYPLTGLFADTWGFHAPFWFGAAISAAALALAAAVLPSSRHLQRRPLDGPGAALLAAGLITLLLCLSEGETWGWGSGRLLLLAAASAGILGVWVRHSLRTAFPLVNLRLMRHPAVLTANATGLFAGLAMYMLLPLVTRYVQAPIATGYGFGVSVVVAGLVLLPFSVASVGASRLLPLVARQFGRRAVLPLGVMFLAAAMLIFLLAKAQLWQLFLVMGVAGLGTGLIFAAIPGVILRSVPSGETGSALGVNQVVRQIGFSIGSALGAAILTGHTIAPDLLPTDSGYDTAAVVGIALCLLTAVLSAALPRLARTADETVSGPPAVADRQERVLMDESADGAAGGLMLMDADSTGRVNSGRVASHRAESHRAESHRAESHRADTHRADRGRHAIPVDR